jgi:CO/xanthine dehydrogenase Mo-binding subunit
VTAIHESEFSRRQFVKAGGALIVGFSVLGGALGGKAAAASGSGYYPPLGDYGPDVNQLDTWLSINADNTVTLYTGVIPMGTGSLTGLLQIAADELDVPFDAMHVVTPDTNRTPDQFVSSGSRAISQHGPPIRQAAAEARNFLLGLASTQLGVPQASLTVTDGVVSGGGKSVKYSDLLGGKLFSTRITGTVKPKTASQYKLVGTSVPRIDIPAKASGAYTYIQNIRLPGMLHGRVVRPPSQGATLVSVKGLKKDIPGVQVLRKNDWLAVVAPHEYDAIEAAQFVDAQWSDWAGLPPIGNLPSVIRTTPVYDPAAHPNDLRVDGQLPDSPIIQNTGSVDKALAGAAKTLSVTYSTPYHSHASIGPSCAVAMWEGGKLTVWSSTQTPYGTREALAKFFGLPNNSVRLISVEGSGNYGQNGSDDAAFDAAMMSQLAGKPVRVQWMRWDELAWENYKSARLFDMSGGVDATGKIVAWKSESWGFTGYGRPEYHEPIAPIPAQGITAKAGRQGGEPGSLLAAQLAGWTGTAVEEGYGGGQGSAPYPIANAWAKFNYLGPTSQRFGPVRIKTGSMRTVNSFDNTFASESFMDELAVLAGIDAVQFRLNHTTDPRTIAVLKAAADKAGWDYRPSPNPNRGTGNLLTGRGVVLAGRVAHIFEVVVDKKTGKVTVPRVTVALDAGQHVNPDEIENQIEGATVMGISRVVVEEVKWNKSAITSRDWVTYPLLRIMDAPQEIDIVLLPQQDQASSGVGEAPQSGVGAGVANAFFDATGVRMRSSPLSPPRVRAALKDAGIA